MSYRLGLLEDESLTRLTLSTALRSLEHEVVVESADPAVFLKRAKTAKLDAVLLDLHLGSGPTGVDVGTELRKSNPDLGIVFLTSFEDPRLLDPHLGQLPVGSIYLIKGEIKEMSVLNDAISDAIAKLQQSPRTGAVQLLSDTQVETLRLVAQGLSNAEIAKRRYITEKSVEITISRIAKALGISNEPTANQRVHIAKVYFRSRGISVE